MEVVTREKNPKRVAAGKRTAEMIKNRAFLEKKSKENTESVIDTKVDTKVDSDTNVDTKLDTKVDTKKKYDINVTNGMVFAVFTFSIIGICYKLFSKDPKPPSPTSQVSNTNNHLNNKNLRNNNNNIDIHYMR